MAESIIEINVANAIERKENLLHRPGLEQDIRKKIGVKNVIFGLSFPNNHTFIIWMGIQQTTTGLI